MSCSAFPNTYFNPRSPHGERRCTLLHLPSCNRFQSTLPARGATRAGLQPHRVREISIHAPRTGSDPGSPAERRNDYISIHAPRTGSDRQGAGQTGFFHISIHAPRTGSDSTRRRGACASAHFNPRSPHGERLAQGYQINPATIFQSTLPARGATKSSRAQPGRMEISIHAPRTGSDLQHAGGRRAVGISIHAPRTGSD